MAIGCVVLQALALLDEQVRPVVRHQCGERTLDVARAAYDDPETRKIALAAAQTEADRYPLETRVEEVMSFVDSRGGL